MKNVNLKGIALVITMSLLATGCSLQGNAKTKATPVTVNEDVQLESSLADSSLAIERKPAIEIGRAISNQPFDQRVSSEQIYFNEKGALYLLDIKEGKERKVADREAFEISEDGNWALSYDDEESKLFIHNLQKGDMELLENNDPGDTHFIGNDIVHVNDNVKRVTLFTPGTSERTTWELSQLKGFSISNVTSENGAIYIFANNEKGAYSLYQLKENEEIETLGNLPGKDHNVAEYTLLQNGSVIFNGTSNGKEGIFYWNKESKEVQQLVSGGEDKEGKWVPFYNLSPDESKILFDMPVQIGDSYKTNVYMAELVDGQLTNSTRIMENADLDAVISIAGGWSADSTSAYVKTAIPENSVGNIAVFQVKE